MVIIDDVAEEYQYICGTQFSRYLFARSLFLIMLFN